MSSQTPPPFKSPYGPPGTPVDTRKLIHFLTDGVQPPSSVYVDVNDALFTEVWSVDTSPVFLMRYRILNPAGEIIQGQEQFVYTVAARNPQQFQVQLTEGFLLSLELQLDATQPSFRTRGMNRARIFILRGTKFGLFLSQMLASGYIDAKNYLTWPNGLIEPAASGQGFIRSVTGTQPAAGAEINEVVPALARWGFRTFHVQLVASATVANRGVRLAVTDAAANTIFAIETGVTQTAGQSQFYSFGLIGTRSPGVLGSVNTVPFPNLTLLPNFKIQTSTVGLQAGDQWSAPQYSVEEWFDT